MDVAAGWPWPALCYRHERFADKSERTSGGWALPFTTTLSGVIRRDATLPLTPILPGLLGDVLIFGTAAGLPLALVRLWRVRVFSARLQHGRCVRCRYDLRPGALATCPECGTMAPLAADQSAASGLTC